MGRFARLGITLTRTLTWIPLSTTGLDNIPAARWARVHRQKFHVRSRLCCDGFFRDRNDIRNAVGNDPVRSDRARTESLGEFVRRNAPQSSRRRRTLCFREHGSRHISSAIVLRWAESLEEVHPGEGKWVTVGSRSRGSRAPCPRFPPPSFGPVRPTPPADRARRTCPDARRRRRHSRANATRRQSSSLAGRRRTASEVT